MARTTRSPESLGISPEVGWYLKARGIPLPKCAPRFKTPEPGELLSDAIFDPDRVDRVLDVFARLRHTKGEWAGRPLRPDPWQVAYWLAPIFGWLRPNDHGDLVRAIRNAYLDVARKNGKTTMLGGQDLYLTVADLEPGAEVYAAAAGKDQARFTFDPIKSLAEKSPDLRPHVKAYANRIVHPRSSSYFAVVSSVADLLHGANVHGAGIDELHVHKNPDLVEALETGTGSRRQPLVAIITTPDDGRPGTIYDRKRLYVEQLSRRVFTDPAQYGVIFGAEPDDNPFRVSTHAKANPGYGISPSREYLVDKANKAKNSPAELATFLRLHLGLRTKQRTRYIDLGQWDATAGLVDERKLRGRECAGGLDLASVSDVTALCWTFDDDDDGVTALWRLWIPEGALREMNRRTAGEADVWVRAGFLEVTPGNVIDNGRIIKRILTDAEKFTVTTVGYDRWGANDVVKQLGDNNIECVPIGQGFASLSAPTKELQRLVLAGRYRHGGNPVLRWMVDNLAVATDAAENVKPDKKAAGDKIDGISAAVNALRELMAGGPPTRSIYEDQDLETG